MALTESCRLELKPERRDYLHAKTVMRKWLERRLRRLGEEPAVFSASVFGYKGTGQAFIYGWMEAA